MNEEDLFAVAAKIPMKDVQHLRNYARRNGKTFYGVLQDIIIKGVKTLPE